ncbi:MAG: ABC transporter permease [Vicinamibacteraceae bacterium]
MTCALGIGSSVAMFSVVDAVLLRPLPYPDPGRVVTVYPTIPAWRGHPSLHASWDRASFSLPEYFDWQERQTSFVQTALVGSLASTLFGDEGAERITVGRATHELFALLGAAPVLGRSFTLEDERSGALATALISHAFWQSRFGGAPDVIGHALRLEGGVRTIVGVLPAHFQLEGYTTVVAQGNLRRNTSIWIPVSRAPDETQRDNHSFRVIARLRDGVGVSLSEKHTGRPLIHGANIVPRLRDDTRLVRTPLMILLAGILAAARRCLRERRGATAGHRH